MANKFSNNASSRLAGAINTASATFNITPGDGAKFPAITSGDSFMATLVKSDGSQEIIKVTARSTDTFTIQRAQEGTAAQSFSSGDRVEHRLTAGALTEELERVFAAILPQMQAFGLGADSAPRMADIDADVLPGFYAVANTATGARPISGAATVLVERYSGVDGKGWAKQTYTARADENAIPRTFIRTKNFTTSTWGAWSELANLNDIAMQLSLAGGQMTGQIKYAPAVTIASAATPNLSTAGSNLIAISGTAAISNWTITDGQVLDVVFTGAGTLTHHATNNNLPSGANIARSSGDRCTLARVGSTTYVLNYQRADGRSVVESSIYTAVSRRQTVMNGAIDANGQASFLSAGTGLSVNIAAAATAIKIAFAAGFTASGELDFVGDVTANTSIGSLSANSTLFLYADRNVSNGAITYGFTDLVPNYGYGITKSTVNGKHTYRIDEGVMYVGNGTTANAVQRVFLGECVTGASTVTAVTTYALNGVYDGPWTNTLPSVGTLTSRNHNIGVQPDSGSFVIENIAADSGWQVGDRLTNPATGAAAGQYPPITPICGRMTVAVQTGATPGSVILPARTSGGAFVATSASWKYKLTANRGW